MKWLKFNTSVSGTWWFEWLSLSGSAVCLAAIISLLFYFDEKPVSTWNGITLNATIAVLSTANKIWLLLVVSEVISQWKWIVFSREKETLECFDVIDSASRGPLGCLRAFCGRPGKSANLRIPYANLQANSGRVCLLVGILIMIFSVGIDPFFQQLIRFETRVICNDNEKVTIPVGIRYARGVETETPSIVELGRSGDDKVERSFILTDSGMRFAIMSGYLNPFETVRQQLHVDCPSGNCRWTPYQSLGICSRCFDVSEHLTKSIVRGVPQLANLRFIDLEYDAEDLIEYALPNRNHINNPMNSSDQSIFMRLAVKSTANPKETIKFQSNSLILWSSTFLNATSDWNANGTDVQATECSLYFCVNQHISRVDNGILVEEAQHAEWSQKSLDSWQPDTSEIKPNVKATYCSNDPLCYESDLPDQRTDLMIGDGFNISKAGVDSISSFLASQVFKSRYDVLVEGDFNAYVAAMVTNHGEKVASSFISDPEAMLDIYKRGDLRETFATLALSLSNAIREGSETPSKGPTVVKGQSGVTITMYKIQWPWIALPSALTLATLFFLWHCIQQTEKLQVPLWKSSALPVLACGTCVSGQFQDRCEVSAMRQTARNTFVRLLDDPGLSLEANGAPPMYSRRMSLPHIETPKFRAITRVSPLSTTFGERQSTVEPTRTVLASQVMHSRLSAVSSLPSPVRMSYVSMGIRD